MDRLTRDGGTGAWSIVLAGGKGRRLRRFTERWLGRYVPKQYCAFVGKRSMLQHTLDRARRVSRPERIATIVADEHRELARQQIATELAPGVIFQPADRDTAAGVFLPLAQVRQQSRDATVVIFPADHFVYPERSFVDTVGAAVRAVEDVPDKLVLLGVRPDDLEPDYGWIVPGERLTSSGGTDVEAVRSFFEKPSLALANAARVRGGLWNTMVIAARAETLWQLGKRYLSAVVDELEPWIEGGCRPSALSAIYRSMPRHNFSSELLGRATRHIAVVTLDDVLWSDWGREQRITETLEQIGLRPAWAHAHVPSQRETSSPHGLAVARA